MRGDRVISCSHIELKEVPTNHFVKGGGVRERDIVPAHTHLALVVSHGVCWIGDADLVAAGEEGKMPLVKRGKVANSENCILNWIR
jgi:hypothetical protein